MNTDGTDQDNPLLKAAQSYRKTDSPALDREAAKRFLRFLDPDCNMFTFQTFDDSESRKNRALARTLHGTLEQHWATLGGLSRRGAGVFVCINRTDGSGKRATENVVAVRAIFADCDKVSPELLKERLLRLGLFPHLINQTSPDKWHIYWRVDGVPLNEFRTMQERLAAFLGSDQTIKDLTRVMRLPGFPHQKDGCQPSIVRIAFARETSSYRNAYFQEALAKAERHPTSLANEPRTLAAGLASGPPSPPDMRQGYPDGQRTGELLKRVGWCLGPKQLETVEVCLAWNRNNTPPLAEEKVRHPVASIAKSEARKREANSHPINTESNDKRPAAQFAPPLMAPTPWHEKTFTAAELKAMTFEPVRYIVPQYVSEGVTLLIGRPKIGKSWLALDLAVACASDRTVLGSLKADQGAVLYLALEDGKRRLQRRLDKLLSPFSSVWPERLSIVQTGDWRRADQGGLEDIDAWCASATKPVLVVIDTLARFRKPTDGKQQLYAADTEAIACLQKIAVKHGLAIAVVHHDRKAEADDPFDTVSGTLGLTGAADTILIVKRQPDGSFVLHARGRDIEEKDTALKFDKTTCQWTILGEASAVHRSAERQRVIAALDRGPLSVGEIMAATGITKRNAADLLLGRMARDGEIRRIRKGQYALADQSEPKAADARQIRQTDRSHAR